MSSISPMICFEVVEVEDSSSSSSSSSKRKRFISPIMREGASSCFGVIVVEAVAGEVGGRQAMKVSLSGSWRQDRCMSYSSGRLRGSEAVRAWSSFFFLACLYTVLKMEVKMMIRRWKKRKED